MQNLLNFTNTDVEDFEGMYHGEKFMLRKGETRALTESEAKHLANQLAVKILIREGKDFIIDPKKEILIKEMLGELMAPTEESKEELTAKVETPARALKDKEKEFEDLKEAGENAGESEEKEEEAAAKKEEEAAAKKEEEAAAKKEEEAKGKKTPAKQARK